MKSPEYRYNSDPDFRALVDHMVSAVFNAKFTPSELREAAVLASIKYEMHHWRGTLEIDPEVASALDVLNGYYTTAGGPK